MDLDRPPDIVVVAGGDPVAPRLVASVPVGACVIAADAGVDLARALGWSVDVAVGDFDSLAVDDVARLEELAREVHMFETDKDATDLELALAVAADMAGTPTGATTGTTTGVPRVLVMGLEGGRPDHALANLLVASSERFAHLDVELVLERGRAWVARDGLTGRLPPGAILSLVPVHGAAVVSVDGVRWPLDHARLVPGSTRGVSNEVLDGPVALVVHDGALLCINPRTPEEP